MQKTLQEIQERISQRPLFGSAKMDAIVKRPYCCSEAEAVKQAIDCRVDVQRRRLQSISCQKKLELEEIQERVIQRPLFGSSQMHAVMKRHYYSKTEGWDGMDSLESIATK